MEFEDFCKFMQSVVLPLKAANPTARRLDGQEGIGNRDAAGLFWHNGTLWKVHSDTHYEPLIIAFEAAKRGADPFVEETTSRGLCLALTSDLRAKQRSRFKHLYIYSWS